MEIPGEQLGFVESVDQGQDSKQLTLAKYRHTFTRDAATVSTLADILTECHFGCTLNPNNPAEVAEHNVGVTILAKLGAFREDNLIAVINALTGIGGATPAPAQGVEGKSKARGRK